MKKRFVLFMAVSVLLMAGCGKDSPEADARDYITKSLAFDKKIQLDTSGLEYKVGEETDGKATVTVSGNIKCDGELVFVREKGTWVLVE